MWAVGHAQVKSAYEQLIHQCILNDNHVITLGKVLGIQEPCAIEDLFEQRYYLSHVHAAYAKELASKKLKLPKKHTRRPTKS